MNIKNTDMNTQEISELLDRFYNGETTEDEDRFLRDYFHRPEIASEFEDDREIFNYFRREGEIQPASDDLERRIIKALEDDTKVLLPLISGKRLYYLIGIAASILITISIWLLVPESGKLNDTYSDPALAYAETMKILYSVSAKMNNGFDAMKPVGRISEAADKSFRTLSNSTGMIGDNLKKLEGFSKAMNIAPLPVRRISENER